MKHCTIGKSLLYNGDCYKVLNRLIKNKVKVDAVITDPPYLFDSHGGTKAPLAARQHKVKREISFMSNGFDYSIFEKCELLHCYNYVVFCSNAQITSLMSWFEQRGYSVTLCVWHKTNASPLCNNKYKSDFDYIVYARKSGVQFNNFLSAPLKSRLYQFPVVNYKSKQHPSQKPLVLMERLVNLHSLKNGIVLDLFMGSGTTGVACKHLRRKFIGIEQREDFYKISKKRVRCE